MRVSREDNGAQSGDLPLCVDLDGTLIRSDILLERIASMLRTSPLVAFMIPLWLFRGRAYLKERIREHSHIDMQLLPYQPEFIEYLRSERTRGRALHLVSAAAQPDVEEVASHLNLFDSATGSSGKTNLKGAQKAEWLRARFPEGFAYAGNSGADLQIWNHATSAIPVNASARTLSRIAGLRQEASFDSRAGQWNGLIRSMRFRHWSKNLLIFVPLILSHQFLNVTALADTLIGFVLFGFLASTNYMFNDLLDLQADRRHRSKKFRPIASGELPIQTVLILLPIMYVGGLAACLALSRNFALVAVAYLLLTAAYSIRLKRYALVDITALAVLFTLRIYLGVVLLGQPAPVWLLMFSLTFFGGLSFVKRGVEVAQVSEAGGTLLPGRGYRAGDEAFLMPWGMGTSLLSTIVLVLYIVNDQMPAGLYHHKEWLWALPMLFFFWQMRVWLLTLRGEMNDDPIEFAFHDRGSWIVAGLTLAVITLAAI